MLYARITSLRWGVGVLTGLIGTMLLIVPYQFASPAYVALQPQLGLWGAAFLLAGIALLLLAVTQPPLWTQVAIHLVVAADLFALAYGFAAAGVWSGTANWVVFGLGTALAPFLARPEDEPQTLVRADLFVVLLGIAAVFAGLALLVLPGQLSRPVYAVGRSLLPEVGVAFLIFGALVVYVQARSGVPQWLYWAAHLIGGGMMLVFMVLYTIPTLVWTGIAFYGGYGLTLMLYPWLQIRLRSFDRTSLQVRLALALGLAAGLPAIAVATLVENLVLPGAAVDVEFVQNLSMLSLLVIVTVAAGAGVLVARWLISPLDALVVAAGRLSHGDMEAPVSRGGPSEINRLASAFDEMRDRLAARTAERERLLEEVQRRATELDLTLSAIRDALIVYGPGGEVVRLNQPAERLFELESRNLRKMSYDERVRREGIMTEDGTLIPPEETPAARALRGEVVTGYRMMIRRSDGQVIHLLTTTAPIKDDEGQLIGVIADYIDITQIVELQQLQKDLISIVAHDIRQPLTVILGQARVAEKLADQRGLDAIAKSTEAIATSARRMNVMIQDLVDSVRLEAQRLELNRKPIDLAGYLQQLLQRSSASMDVTRVKLTVEPALPKVLADPDRLERIVLNVLSNAFKYSAPDTPIEIRVRREDGQALVAVQDHGQGIDPKDLPHIFERFYRAKGRKPGSIGLGLFITRTLVEAHGGRVWVESHLGEGSTFSFTFPLSSE